MRVTRFGSLIITLSLNSVLVIQPQGATLQETQPLSTTPAVTKDTEAVRVVNDVLSVAGGLAAIAAVTDYTGTGTITYHGASDVQGVVTVRAANGLGNLRIDAALPSGVRSEAIRAGQTTVKTEDGGITPLHLQAPISPGRLILPYLLLTPVVNSPAFSLFYKGLVDVDGHPAHDIQLVRILPGVSDPNGLIQEYSTIEFFVDSSTLQLVMMEDVVFNHMARQVRYSDYRVANGVLVPFSINEQRAGNSTWQISLTQITFNTGLQDSDFQL